MPGITFTRDNVDRSREFLIQYLRDSGFEGSLEDGTGLNDLLIKGYSLLFTLMQQQVDKAMAYQSLTKAMESKELLGEEYDTAIDAIVSNFFVARKDGTSSKGRIRLWFSRPVDFLQLQAGSPLFKHNEDMFGVDQNYTFSPTDFDGVSNTPQFREEYSVDVDVVSMDNKEISISAGDRFSSYINNIYFIRAEAVHDFNPGKDKESSEDLISRTEKVLTTRELVSVNGITTVLTEEFATVNDIYVSCHGDPEQIRDVVVFDDISIHVGNKADIYIKAPFSRTTVTAVVGAAGFIDVTPLTDYGHVAHIIGITEADGITSVSFTMASAEQTWLSHDAPCAVYITGVPEGDEVTIDYLYLSEVQAVSSFVLGAQRVVCYDPLVKSMHPIELSFELGVFPKIGVELATLQNQVSLTVQEFILGLAFQVPFTESTLIEYLHRNIPDLSYIQNPINVQYRMYDEGSQTYITGTCPTQFLVPNVAGLSDQVTPNTVQLFTSQDLISFI